jgi:hypothetical protein
MLLLKSNIEDSNLVILAQMKELVDNILTNKSSKTNFQQL